MELTEIKRIVAAGIPGDRGNAEALSGDLVKMAIAAIGRMDGITFNETRRTFALIAGQSEYEIGSDIWNGAGNVIAVAHMSLTDVIGSPIMVMPADQFDAYASGSTNTGRTIYAKLYYKDKKPFLKVYPTPDQAYSGEATLRIAIDSLEHIPDHFHQVVVAKGLEYAAAFSSGQLASMLAKEGVKDLVENSLSKWDGTVIPLARSLDQGDNRLRADSGNLRP